MTQSNTARPDHSARVGENLSPQSLSAPDRKLETNQSFADAYNSAPRRINKRIMVAEVQRQLMNRGHYGGSIDGRYGRRTAFALGAFQLQSGLPQTGRLDTTTLEALGLSDSNLAYLQPAPRSYETWVPITKFKHGKWKVKWKKLHRDEAGEYGENDQGEDRDAWWDAEHHDD